MGEPDFARAGCISSRDVFITNEMLANHPVSMMEQQFRKQGLPVKIDNGKIVLLDEKKEYRLCKAGETLSPEKCKALSILESNSPNFESSWYVIGLKMASSK